MNQITKFMLEVLEVASFSTRLLSITVLELVFFSATVCPKTATFDNNRKTNIIKMFTLFLLSSCFEK
jgi:hypothetical protein